MCTHLCTSSLELIFSDDEFGDDAEHAWTLKQLNAYDMLCVYLLLHKSTSHMSLGRKLAHHKSYFKNTFNCSILTANIVNNS